MNESAFSIGAVYTIGPTVRSVSVRTDDGILPPDSFRMILKPEFKSYKYTWYNHHTLMDPQKMCTGRENRIKGII